MGSNGEASASERLRDTAEMRLMLSVLSPETKENIMKGMLMFEAGYHAGYLDGVNSVNKQEGGRPEN